MSILCDRGDPCPGCEKPAEAARYNAPSLPAISYRLGTHGRFFEQMLDRIHTNELLRQQLTTRDRDDFSIALLDGWAVVLDVLTFYQERIANEGFLRTATERRSVLEMARTIGYELNPGLVASTYLAFTVDDTDPNYATVKMPQGVQVQSIPAQGQLPQTFETSEDFEAHVQWNELKPRSTRHQTLGIGSDGKLYLLSLVDTGTTSARKAGDFYLVNPDPFLKNSDSVLAVEVNQVYLRGVATNLHPGDLLLLMGKKGASTEAVVRHLAGVDADKELDRTVVRLAGVTAPAGKVPEKTVKQDFSVASGLRFNTGSIAAHVLHKDIGEETLQALMTVNRWDSGELMKHVTAVQAAGASLSEDQGVFALREYVGFFGSNAPGYNKSISENYSPSWDTSGWEIWKNYPDGKYYSSIEDYRADVYLERKVEGIGKGGWVLFDSPYLDGGQLAHKYLVYQVDDTTDQSITGFSLSGKTTGLKLKTLTGSLLLDPDKSNLNKLKVRNTSVHARSEALGLTDLPVEEDLEAEGTDSIGKPVTTGVSSIKLDTIVLGLRAGQPVIANGELADAAGVIAHETALLKEVVHSRGFTIIYLEKALKYRYLRDTVTINANVVTATHGETANEVLGSGDGTSTNQGFVLKKPALTYVPASTASGAESTMRVMVDGIEWDQALSLYNIGPNRQSYVVRLDNDGAVNITFGDGKQGTRLPTGQENIMATYRSGIGAAGNVAADSIKLLKTRSQGIRSVNNPIAASGSQEPEILDNARTNAPRTVLTMERIVSLKDYEDFARTYAGIGKAQAVILWNGKTEMVHLTIAASNGDTVDPGSVTYRRLSEAIDTYRDHLAMVQVDTFEKRLFRVKAKLLINRKYTVVEVLEEAEIALKEAFSFGKRDFGQPVTSAEVISILQQVAGVTAVDLDKLYLTDAAYVNDTLLGPSQTQPPPVLPSLIARWPEGGAFQKAVLLLINPFGITLEEQEQ
ncbi:MAG: putative baseplate assembly protein [Chloroflexi bacterium]|nr:putative baseplate assembly protein [Chloroflexota bacterium]